MRPGAPPQRRADSPSAPALSSSRPSPKIASARPEQAANDIYAFASESELEKSRWTPGPAPAAKQAGSSSWLNTASRTPAIVWVLAAIAMVQAALIAFWLLPASSTSSAAASSANMGSVVVTSQPPEAAVLIDDVPRGLTPLTISLVPGRHQVTVGLDGAMHNQSVDVAGAEAPVHFDIGPAPVKAPAAAAVPAVPAAVTGALNINTEPAGVQVLVDDVRRGVTPLSVTDLKPGVHVVTVRDSRRSIAQRVMVTQGAVATVFIAMGGRSEFESGSLAIRSPIPVQIRERGALLGSSESAAVLLSTGRHNLELTNPELNYRVERTVEIQAGRRSSLELTVPNGVLNVNAIPWAEVWIAGRALGETPIANVAVPIGTYEVVFRHPELGERRQSVTVRAGGPTRVGIDLRKGQ
jgi:PEGA domain